MLGKASNTNVGLSSEYREETAKLPVAITVAAVLLVGIPLAVWIFRIDEAGKISADISKYETLVQTVDGDVQTVDAILDKDAEAINAADKKRTVTLIVPEIVIVEDRKNGSEKQSSLNIALDGIYWNPDSPLATIDGETYREGDTIQGYTIIEIGKRSVRFKGKDGTIVEKDMYEDLLRSQR